MGYTPMMQQYLAVKKQYSDTILFFRLGDFYEMFLDDALLASRVLEITLTGRDAGMKEKVPMCGVPYHAAESYISKLVGKGYKVAICEQIEDPKLAKGIVRREVIRVVTPGTILEGQLLDDKSNNYVVSIAKGQNGYGLGVADITTGLFKATAFTGARAAEFLLDEVTRISPAEIILPQNDFQDQGLLAKLKNLNQPTITGCPDQYFLPDQAGQALQKQIMDYDQGTSAFGGNPMAHWAAGALMIYLRETQKRDLAHMTKLDIYYPADFMVIDSSARRNLEITRGIRDGGKKGSLLSILDHTTTAMGGRLLKNWLEQPLLDLKAITARQTAIEELLGQAILRADIKKLLDEVYDLERLTARAAYGTANARDLLAVKKSLLVLPRLKTYLTATASELLQNLADQINPLNQLVDLLTESVQEEPPVSLREGGLIKDGYNEEVDQYRSATKNGKNWLADLESRERTRTGIKSLKVGFNKVFGYYLEITKSNLSAVPADYQRRQTLANAERYITPELKELENLILGAEEKLIELEYKLFVEIRQRVAAEVAAIQKTALAVAAVDALVALADAAEKNLYVKPQVDHSDVINISEGRHPVVEAYLDQGRFVPNDTYLDGDKNRLALITGPNMGGKSTYQRQVALIVLMAQVGSFVPAKQAAIGLVDRIFARVGASDDLSMGQSTFMVEMSETKQIITSATNRSLVIIDELGRGTSNLEGMAIARAVIEYLHDNIGCRTLFSTHYHELAELEAVLEGLKNYVTAVQEWGDNVTFLRKVIPDRASKSYGVHCARLAGLPQAIIDRANAIEAELEEVQLLTREAMTAESELAAARDKLTDTAAKDLAALKQQLLQLDLINLSPIEALNYLFHLQKELAGK